METSFKDVCEQCAGQKAGEYSPWCDKKTRLVVESALGLQSGKTIDLIGSGDLSFSEFQRIGVMVKKSGMQGLTAGTDVVDGYYGGNSKRRSEIVELKSGRFRYWSKAPVGGSDDSKQPIVGTYSRDENGFIRLEHPALATCRWSLKRPSIRRCDRSTLYGRRTTKSCVTRGACS